MIHRDHKFRTAHICTEHMFTVNMCVYCVFSMDWQKVKEIDNTVMFNLLMIGSFIMKYGDEKLELFIFLNQNTDV